MAVTRKVQSKVAITPKKVQDVVAKETTEPVVAAEKPASTLAKAATRVKKCPFCTHKSEPYYWDSTALRKFLSDRGRIVPRTRSGVCAKHQRRVSKQIKYARHLAILPFMVRA